MGDLLRASEVVASRGIRLGAPLSVVDETESTNDDAKKAAREGAPHGAVWIAESQTRGRGRQGRVWASPPGDGLLFSVLLRIPCPPSRVPPLALVCGLAVRDAAARAIGDDAAVRVKWPNDVVVGDHLRKVAGVLVESQTAGARVESIVVGVGLNVFTRAFPPELAGIATSVALSKKDAAPIDRAEILADILSALDRDVELAAHRGLGAVHARLARWDALVGLPVESETGAVRGTGAGIDAEGRLLVRDPSGTTIPIASGTLQVGRLR